MLEKEIAQFQKLKACCKLVTMQLLRDLLLAWKLTAYPKIKEQSALVTQNEKIKEANKQ